MTPFSQHRCSTMATTQAASRPSKKTAHDLGRALAWVPSAGLLERLGVLGGRQDDKVLRPCPGDGRWWQLLYVGTRWKNGWHCTRRQAIESNQSIICRSGRGWVLNHQVSPVVDLDAMPPLSLLLLLLLSSFFLFIFSSLFSSFSFSFSSFSSSSFNPGGGKVQTALWGFGTSLLVLALDLV